MDLNLKEKELISNYLPTLKRFYKQKIRSKYFKIPFKENYILKLSMLNDDTKIISKIIKKINYDDITNEDIFFSLNYYYDFNKNDKLNIQNFLYKSDENDLITIKFKTNIILLSVKYFQYYHIINEFLFENENINDNKELFYSIYLFLKNKEIIDYSKKYFRIKVFMYFINDLFKIYKKNIDILLKNDIIQNNNIKKYFINSILNHWNISYKVYIENNTFNSIEELFKIKKNKLINIVCSNNLC